MDDFLWYTDDDDDDNFKSFIDKPIGPSALSQTDSVLLLGIYC